MSSAPQSDTGTDPSGEQGLSSGAIADAAASLPFNRLVGLTCEEIAPGRAAATLPADERLQNHIGSVHAVAELAPAEAAGGIAAVTGLSDLLERGYLPVARSLSVRYRRLARGALTATAELPDATAETARAAADAGERIGFILDVEVRDEEQAVAEVAIEYVFVRLDAQTGGST